MKSPRPTNVFRPLSPAPSASREYANSTIARTKAVAWNVASDHVTSFIGLPVRQPHGEGADAGHREHASRCPEQPLVADGDGDDSPCGVSARACRKREDRDRTAERRGHRGDMNPPDGHVQDVRVELHAASPAHDPPKS